MNLDPETTERLKSSDKGGISASVEALKTKKAAEAMTAALRQFNPKLAKALIDDRDEVTILCYIHMHIAVHVNSLLVLACVIPLCHSMAHALSGICLQLDTLQV